MQKAVNDVIDIFTSEDMGRLYEARISYPPRIANNATFVKLAKEL